MSDIFQDPRLHRHMVFAALTALEAVHHVRHDDMTVAELADNLEGLDCFEGLRSKDLIPHVHAWIEAVEAAEGVPHE